MANYDFNMAEMQKDAIRRVNQMQKKADYYVNGDKADLPAQENNDEKADDGENSAKANEESKGQNADNNNNKQGSFFSSFDLQNPLSFLKNITEDKNSLIVLGLILILYKEGADQMLIFALIYILL